MIKINYCPVLGAMYEFDPVKKTRQEIRRELRKKHRDHYRLKVKGEIKVKILK